MTECAIVNDDARLETIQNELLEALRCDMSYKELHELLDYLLRALHVLEDDARD